MSSIVIIKLEKYQKITDEFEHEWNEEKQGQLEAYIKKLVQDKTNKGRALYQIDWEQLKRNLEVSDKGLLQRKVDEIYEAQYANLFDKVKGNMIHDVDFHNHKLYNEVQNMISSLDLAKFVSTVEVESSPRESLKEEEENKRKEDFVREGGDESEDRPEKDGTRRNETQEKERREEKTEKRKSPLLRTEDQNKVQNRQNQNMINLPKSGQELDIKRSLLLTNIRSQHDGHFKPTPESSSGSPLTGISNINVTTKADLNSLACKKSESTHIKEGMKNVSRKIKLSMSKKTDSRRESLLPIGVQNEDRPSLSNHQKRTYPSIPDQIKSNRRRSLVGETLPKYIRNQLAENSNNFHKIENSSNISNQSKKVLYDDGNSLDNASNRHASESPKLDSRIQNVMANSQSLYLNSKSSDRKTHEGIHRYDNDRSVNGSTYGQHDEASVSNFSEGEVDYISPSSFTKYYETLNADYDQGSREYEDSNVDFVNLNGSDDANSEPYESGQSDDDSYLFKI